MAARRRSKKPARRRTPKKVNVLNVAQSVILGNAVTQGLFNTNMIEFVTGKIGSAYTPGAIGESSQITLPELFGAGMGVGAKQIGGVAGFGGTTLPGAGYGGVHGRNFGEQLKLNLQANGTQMITTLIVTPIAFKVISGLAKKPRAEFNRLARMVGVPVSL